VKERLAVKEAGDPAFSDIMPAGTLDRETAPLPLTIAEEVEAASPLALMAETEATLTLQTMAEAEAALPPALMAEDEAALPPLTLADAEVTPPPPLMAETEIALPPLTMAETEVTSPPALMVETEVALPPLTMAEAEVTPPPALMAETEIALPPLTMAGAEAAPAWENMPQAGIPLPPLAQTAPYMVKPLTEQEQETLTESGRRQTNEARAVEREETVTEGFAQPQESGEGAEEYFTNLSRTQTHELPRDKMDWATIEEALEKKREEYARIMAHNQLIQNVFAKIQGVESRVVGEKLENKGPAD
jgi:hypothetical protein